MRKIIGKRVGTCLLVFSMLFTGSGMTAMAKTTLKRGTDVETKTGSIVLDGNNIKADNVNGLTYKGFGMLSGNSTSDLLLDYKTQNPVKYAELMQYLFGGEYPIFTHVKLEMGNDRNNSTGPESATMRTKGESANVMRNPGWQIAADAKKINPKVKVSILSWNTPTWVTTTEEKYYWYKQSILAAYEKYGFMVDYINPNVNEKWNLRTDVANTKSFASWIAAEDASTIPDAEALKLYHKIKLIVSDEANVVSDSVTRKLKADADFMNAVDVVGYHYKTADDNNGGMTWLAQEQDKEVWNSEEQATFSNSAFRPANNNQDPTVTGTGLGGAGSALEMGNTVIKSFVESRRSHVIYQPVVGSFYEGAQFSFKELVSARDPWSGWMHYDAGLLVLAHISKFAVTGWENDDNTAGIWRGVPSASKASAIQSSSSNAVDGRNGGENYVTLAAPTKDNFSTVVVNDSEYPMTYTLKTTNMNLKADQKLEVWETRAADEGAFNENYMKCTQSLTADEQGVYHFAVQPYSTVTVTSLEVADSAEHTQKLPVEGKRTVLDTDRTGDVQNTEDAYLYADDFEYKGKTVPVLDGKGGFTGETQDYITARGGQKGAMARYTHTLNGAFEVYQSRNGNHVLRQQSDQTSTGVGSAWNAGDPVTTIGDFRWTNYTAAVDVLFERAAQGQYAQVGIRQTGSSHKITDSSGYSLKIKDNGEWALYRKTVTTDGKEPQALASGTVDEAQITPGTWFQIKLRGEGNLIKAYINNVEVGSYEDDTPITSGRVALGCSSTYTRFDNLAVTKINGFAPYYSEYIDNMETYDLTEQKNQKLAYNDKWSVTCANQGMYVYQRSISKNTEAGATLRYTFNGTGFEILGENAAGKAKLNVTIDGKEYQTNASIKRADNMCTTYQVNGLENGEHTFTIEVAEGTLAVDAVAVIGGIYTGSEVDVLPKEGTETNLPEEELPTEPVQTPQPTVTPTQEPTMIPTPQPTQIPQPTAGTSPTQKPTTETIKKGTNWKINGMVFEVTNAKKKTVKCKKAISKKVKKVTIPAVVVVSTKSGKQSFTVTEIAPKAFSNCKKLKKVVIGKNVTQIGKEAFSKDSSLQKITFQTTKLKKVGKNAIKGIAKKAVLTCPKKSKKAYQKIFTKKTGFQTKMKWK